MRRQILIADSEPKFRERCRAALEAAGHSVSCAASRWECARRVEQERPALVILDLRLDGGGMEALGEIQQGAAGPLVILTSRCHLADEPFLVWSADACVEKADDLSPLLAAVRRLLATRHLLAARRSHRGLLPAAATPAVERREVAAV